MKRSLSTFLATLFLAFPTWADVGHTSHDNARDHAAMTTTLSQGQVQKVDKAQNKLTIKHEPLDNLGMPAMTMVFRVRDVSWLDQVNRATASGFWPRKLMASSP